MSRPEHGGWAISDRDRRILVIGGTRGTGLLIARRLAAQGRTVRVLARDPARARPRVGNDLELVQGDITCRESLLPAIRGVGHIIFTAGCRSGRPARERTIRATEYEGVIHTLDVARQEGFSGRFLYMTATGVLTPSLMATLLNAFKGNTLRWRLRAEEEIRASGIEYSVIRAGVLVNRPGGRRRIEVTQGVTPMSPRFIARADVAEVFVAALDHPRAAGASFDVVWAARGGEGIGGGPPSWRELLMPLQADRCRVFFYGLFMDQDLLRAKGLAPRDAELASVEGLELRIGQRAALVPAPRSRVHGVVLSLRREELTSLYAEPGLSLYVPEPVRARLATGDIRAVQCYNLREAPAPTDRNPEYALKLRAVAERVGLPAEYIASIR